MPIRVLAPELINQIAAGEVVERPASVVKELVENAIDAGARRILVEVEGGGSELIRVSDDGGGIARDELPLAVASHATSKVSTSEDLAAIRTLGFRGEALASIASVSRFRLSSCERGAIEGAELCVDGGIMGVPRPAPPRQGTVVEVRTLFYNIPARRKFLRSEGAETARVTDALEAIALSHPCVAFELRSSGRRLLDLPATDEPRRRTLDVLGTDLAPELIEFEEHFPELGDLVVRGFAGRPGIARPSARAIRIHLNGRPIMDRLVLHAVRDTREVDVNVHPAKSEVRFRSQQGIHSAVRRAIERALRGANLVPTFVPDAFRTSAPFGSGMASSTHTASPDFSAFAALSAAAGVQRVEAVAASEPAISEVYIDEFPFMQVLSGYIVTQDADGVVLVDQHALHERAMFAMFMDRLQRGPLESQRLLVPVIIECSARSVGALAEIAPLLARLGVVARAFGPRSIAIEAIPTLLHSRRVDAGAFLSDVLEKAVEHGSLVSLEAALHEVVDMMSCKAAVKAGDELTRVEIRELLRMRESIERSSACPHGRPTSIRIARSELERRFGRS